MKKIIALFVILTLALSVLASCGDRVVTTLPEGMSGKDAASLILANERLNSQLLKNSNNIFEDGSETLMDLAEKVRVSLASNTVIMDEESGKADLAGTTYKTVDGSYVNINGNRYRWGGFTEYSNSYEYFKNLTTNITNSAEMGATLIDDVKKYVRVVDMWVDVHGVEYYLHVEENSELLFSRRDEFVEICRRTKTEDGSNLYEIARVGENGGTMRMVYCEGKICEYSYIYESFNHNFLAVNNKGFWEVVDVGVIETHYNVSCMVIKNDICYDSFYAPEAPGQLGMMKIISSDRKTDIINFLSGEEHASISVKLQAFTGYKGIEVETTPDKVKPLESLDYESDLFRYTDTFDNPVYVITNQRAGKVLLDNGKTIAANDRFLDGKVVVHSVFLEHFGREPDETTNGRYGGGYVPSFDIVVDGDSFEEQMANFEAFLSEVGLVCTRNIDYVKAGILRAYLELEQFVKYHEWNESPIYTEDDLARGWQNNLAKHEFYKELYNEIKDAEVIDFSNKDRIELAIKFAEIKAQKAASVVNDSLRVKINQLELTVEDTMLFVENESYVVSFALIGKDNTLTHIDTEGQTGVKYDGAEVFTVSGNAEFDIPILALGEYYLAAYISTADGIRTSAYTKLVFTAFTETEKSVGNTKVTLLKQDTNELTVKYGEIIDVNIALGGTAYTGAEMTEALSKEIYKYGFVSKGAALEVLSGSAYVEVTELESKLASGSYRLKYSVANGSEVKEGYVIASYTAP